MKLKADNGKYLDPKNAIIARQVEIRPSKTIIVQNYNGLEK